MRAEPDATVIVLRGGRRIELPFDAKGMMNRRDHGGSLEPATR